MSRPIRCGVWRFWAASGRPTGCVCRAEAGRRLGDVAAALERGEAAAVAGYRYGATVAIDAGLIAAARAGVPAEPDLVAAARRGAATVFPLRAQDLMPRFEGPALGARLKELEARWIASGFELSRAALLSGGGESGG